MTGGYIRKIHFIKQYEKQLNYKSTIMIYPFIPVGLILILILFALYLLIIKKDMKQLKTVLYPGIFFIAIWAIIYYVLFK
jgi:uncharacterized BrkB/YihY/UPF0761 family membrane protein